jgi:hypothetical protein
MARFQSTVGIMKNVAIVFSFLVNIYFLATVTNPNLLPPKPGVPLVVNNVQQPETHVATVVPGSELEAQLRLDIPLSSETVITITNDVPLVVSGTKIELPGLGPIENATIDLLLPSGLQIPVRIDLDIPIDTVIPIRLATPAP